MNPPEPFAYPTVPHARRHGPRGYTDYASYKPWLRDEFTFRCVYCLEREAWYPSRSGAFSVDHFAPRSLSPDRECDYDNLLYACLRCNSFKQASITLPDPGVVALADHLRVEADGAISALSPGGQDLIDLLHLADAGSIAVRRGKLLILRTALAHPGDPDLQALCLSEFGFPPDLPDLAGLKPQGANARPEGVSASYHARRERGELPEFY